MIMKKCQKDQILKGFWNNSKVGNPNEQKKKKKNRGTNNTGKWMGTKEELK